MIAEYTDVVAKWTTLPSIESYLRDSAFNCGPGGAAKILQIALGVKVDGGVGPETLKALRVAEKDPAKLLVALRVAREQYELRVASRREKFWKGLVNRWDGSLDFASHVA
ncbi:MAG: putative peptidoglycan-binding domain-containing protein [Chthoniobacterales bacterium]